MLCEACHKNQATLHLKQVANGTVRMLHLCEECARKNGMDVNGPLSMDDILASIDKAKPAPEADSACPQCGMRRADFKKRGRLGCPACYAAFAADLADLILAIHHSRQHVGKRPVSCPVAVEDLARELEDAIREERFEDAARLRDRLRQARSADGMGKGDA